MKLKKIGHTICDPYLIFKKIFSLRHHGVKLFWTKVGDFSPMPFLLGLRLEVHMCPTCTILSSKQRSTLRNGKIFFPITTFTEDHHVVDTQLHLGTKHGIIKCIWDSDSTLRNNFIYFLLQKAFGWWRGRWRWRPGGHFCQWWRYIVILLKLRETTSVTIT